MSPPPGARSASPDAGASAACRRKRRWRPPRGRALPGSDVDLGLLYAEALREAIVRHHLSAAEFGLDAFARKFAARSDTYGKAA